jgi:hypothetical protein
VRGGVVKIQKAIRRRQSRGIFAQQEALARQLPSPTKYDASTSALAGPAATLAGGDGRFHGHGSIYESEQTPAAGEYQAQASQSSSRHQGVSATFRSRGERFVGHDTIYSVEETPAAGAYDTAPAAPAAASKQASVAFKTTAERFDGHGSIYQASDAPALGTYTPPALGEPEHTTSSSYISKSERFASPGGIYLVKASPGIGTYEPKHDATVKGGVVKIQQAARRRQSRGIFAEQEALARGIPSPGRYQQDMATAPHRAFTKIELKSSPSRVEQKGLCDSSQVDECSAGPDDRSECSAGPDDKSECSAGPDDKSSEVRFSVGGTALGVYEAFDEPIGEDAEDKAPKCKESTFPATIAENSEGSDAASGRAPGLAANTACEDEEAAAGTQAAAAVARTDRNGERLFSVLVELSSNNDVKRSDYYDEESGWDMQGLQSDLLLCDGSATLRG